MENTTDNSDLVEVMTELTISDIKTLDFIVQACLDARMFVDQSIPVVEGLSVKLKQLVSTLDEAD